MEEALPLSAATELDEVLALDPAHVFVAVIVLAVPEAAAGILGIDVDGLHAGANALAEDTERSIEAAGLRVATLRTGNECGSLSGPLPPVAQIVECRLAGQMRS